MSVGRRQAVIQLAVQRSGSRLETETFAFQQPVVLIGRGGDADLVLPDRRLGDLHVYLQEVAGRWAAIDLSAVSSDPDQMQRRIHWFDPDQELQVGPYVISHVAPHCQIISGPAASSNEANQATAVIQFLNGRGKAGAQFSRTITRPITLLGRSRRCDLCLNDQSVADVHAGLVRYEDAVWVADLRRNRSVFVDGQPVCWARLDDGATLQVGKFRLLIQFGGTRGRLESAFEMSDPSAPRGDVQQAIGFSTESVMAFMRHVAEMQERFIECSNHQMQQQTQLMATVLQLLERWQSSPQSASSDGRRLIELQHDLEKLKRKTSRRKRPKSAGRKGADDGMRIKQLPRAAGPQEQSTGRQLAVNQSHGEIHVEESGIECTRSPSPDTSNAQMRLTDRMADSEGRENRLGNWLRGLLG